jgi:pyroglutamyl-peptidase
MRILVTGFEPFDGRNVNPSQQIVAALARRPEGERRATLVTETLPCEFGAAGERLVTLIRELRPDAVVSVGLAASASAIRLERFALNLNDSARPDNGGDLATGRPIDPAGPIGYWSTLPLDAILAALRARDIPAIISNHAGAYVCNHVFYTARREIERLGSDIAAGFVHVPLLDEQERSLPPGAATLSLATMVEALECCLDVLSEAGAATPIVEPAVAR